jgi:hypothetical protein
VNREGGGVRSDVDKWREEEGGSRARCLAVHATVGARRPAATQLWQRRWLSCGVSTDARVNRGGLVHGTGLVTAAGPSWANQPGPGPKTINFSSSFFDLISKKSNLFVFKNSLPELKFF